MRIVQIHRWKKSIVIYSVGDNRVLNWTKRQMIQTRYGYSKLIDHPTFATSNQVGSDTGTIVKLPDKDPPSDKIIEKKAKYCIL